MPLVGEISAFGRSLKKEIKQSKSEMKTEIASIRSDIFSLAISNTSSATTEVYVDSGRAPTHQEVQNITSKAKVHSSEKDPKQQLNIHEHSDLYKKYAVTENQIYLYKT